MPCGESGCTALMCSRKAFSSRGLLAKMGMNSSELAWGAGKGEEAMRGAGTQEVTPAVQQPLSQRPHPAAWSLPVPSAFEAGPIVSTKSFQQLGRLLWYVVHEDLAVTFHVALCLFKRQLADVPQGFLVILWRGGGQSESTRPSSPPGRTVTGPGCPGQSGALGASSPPP